MIFSYGAGLPSLWRSSLYFILLALTFVSLTGCAGQLTKAADYYHSDHPQQALVVLNEGDHTGKRNELLYNFEKGIVLHNLGLYQKSTNQLLKAIKLIDRNEVISINEQVSSLVTTEWLTTYHGEYSERLWAHSYLMMNYLLLGKYDDALVEANQALKRLASHPNALKKDYFTRALIALCFANLDEDNDAYIVYKKLAEDLQSPTPVAADLINSARRLGMTDEVNKYRQYLPPHLPSGEAELVLFIANGQIPKKLPGNVVLPKSIRFSFPYYDNNKTSRPGIKILSSKVYSLPLLSTDLGDVARDCLAARKVKIIAKETLRAASKEAIANLFNTA